ncbi:Putative pectin lyase F-1 [Verticillium dahliae VDG1]|nr:Putative pectin lyase F-1 [Verticillium dahliae VDG1]
MSVKGPDARSVEAAIQAAFGPILHRMSTSASTSRRRSINTKMDKFMGLQQPWVPLRKIHKDSRLRFLSPAEMVTPALWDVPFLNSIIMRASERRLFITQSEAYLQDLHMHDQGWTWQRLREQPRVYPEKSASQDVPEADAHEECWAFTEQLDEPVSAQSSLGMRELATAQRASTSPSQRYFHIDPSLRSPSPNAPLTESRMRGSGGMPDEDSDEHGEADSGSTNLNDDESIYRAATGARFTIAEDSDVQHLRQLQPEDEPWPGIEDQDRISDGENIDPLFSQTADDATSVASSQPSEYPSTQRGWGAQGADDDDDMGFRIHEDDDRMM